MGAARSRGSSAWTSTPTASAATRSGIRTRSRRSCRSSRSRTAWCTSTRRTRGDSGRSVVPDGARLPDGQHGLGAPDRAGHRLQQQLRPGDDRPRRHRVRGRARRPAARARQDGTGADIETRPKIKLRAKRRGERVVFARPRERRSRRARARCAGQSRQATAPPAAAGKATQGDGGRAVAKKAGYRRDRARCRAEHLRQDRGPAARGRGLRARRPGVPGVAGVHAPLDDDPDQGRQARGSARTSPTTPSTTSRCRTPGRSSRSPAAHTIGSFCELVGARPVPGRAGARGLAPVPPVGVRARRSTWRCASRASR